MDVLTKNLVKRGCNVTGTDAVSDEEGAHPSLHTSCEPTPEDIGGRDQNIAKLQIVRLSTISVDYRISTLFLNSYL